MRVLELSRYVYKGEGFYRIERQFVCDLSLRRRLEVIGRFLSVCQERLSANSMNTTGSFCHALLSISNT